MTTAADFPNLHSPIWNAIRITPRGTPDSIGKRLCQRASQSIDVVRNTALHSRQTPLGVIELRREIALAMHDANVPHELIAAWFSGITIDTVRRYISDARVQRLQGAA